MARAGGFHVPVGARASAPPRLSLAQGMRGASDFPPFAAGDSDLVLDVDFRNGETAVDAILVTTNGMTKAGSGGLWSSTLGYNPNGTRIYRHTSNWPASGSTNFDADQCTLYLEVQRSAVCRDYQSDLANFVGSRNTNYAASGQLTLFNAASATGSTQVLGWDLIKSTTNIQTQAREDADTNLFQHKLHEAASEDQGAFAKLTIVLDGTVIRYYDDHNLIYVAAKANATDLNVAFNRLGIGNNTSGSNIFSGYIRRLQVVKRAATPPAHSKLRVAFFGDSNTQRGCGRANAATDTVTDIDAAQNYTSSSGLTSATVIGTNPNVAVQPLWQMSLVRRAANEIAPFFLYNAGQSGHHYRDAANQFDQAYIDAVIAYLPNILVCMGSVNDGVNTAVATYEADVKGILDQFIDGISTLRAIIWLEKPPFWFGNGTNTAAYRTEYYRQLAIERALAGYRGIVSVVTILEAFGGSINGQDYDGDTQRGSHSLVKTWDGINSGDDISGNDVHISTKAEAIIADRIWPVLNLIMSSRPAA